MLNLYRISQTVNSDYDTYDSAIVCAESEDKAKLIHPTEGLSTWLSLNYWDQLCWAPPESIEVELIGYPIDGIKENEVILRSFNAG